MAFQQLIIAGQTPAVTSPIVATALTSAKSETPGTGFVTASVAPTANRLVIAIVASRAAASEVTPTVSGGGMTTWDQINTRIHVTDAIQITAFRALQSSPSSGTMSIDFGVITQTWCLWSLFEIANAATTGSNGADAVVQSATGEAIPGTSLTVTLGAFGSPNNGAVGGFYGSDPGAPGSVFLPGSGFTQIACFRTPFSISDSGMLTEYIATNDTTVDAAFSNCDALGIAFEVKAG